MNREVAIKLGKGNTLLNTTKGFLLCPCGCGYQLLCEDEVVKSRYGNWYRSKKCRKNHLRRRRRKRGIRWDIRSGWRKTEHYKGYIKPYRRTRRRENKAKAIYFLGGECEHCALRLNGKNGVVFEFHHLDGSEKEHNLGSLLLGSWDKIMKELVKCILLCKNCHAIEHYGEF